VAIMNHQFSVLSFELKKYNRTDRTDTEKRPDGNGGFFYWWQNTFRWRFDATLLNYNIDNNHKVDDKDALLTFAVK